MRSKHRHISLDPAIKHKTKHSQKLNETSTKDAVAVNQRKRPPVSPCQFHWYFSKGKFENKNNELSITRHWDCMCVTIDVDL